MGSVIKNRDAIVVNIFDKAREIEMNGENDRVALVRSGERTCTDFVLSQPSDGFDVTCGDDRKRPACLARWDQDGAYAPGNIYWRCALTDTEAKYHIEDASMLPAEPDQIALPPEEETKRDLCDSERKRCIFDVVHRLKWRCSQLPE